MAVQMLYQHDMGGADLPQVFQSFDLSEFLLPEGQSTTGNGGQGAGRGSEAKGEAKKAGAKKGGGAQRPDGEKVRRRVHDAFDHARALVLGTTEHREEIDALIRTQADNWRLERMPVVDRNILRLAVYEMLHEPAVPKLVVLDEAIELAKKYGSDQSSRFVNGLLDGLLKQRAFPGSLT
jgi:N utilization substance protein B